MALSRDIYNPADNQRGPIFVAMKCWRDSRHTDYLNNTEMATNGVKSNGSTGSPKGRFIVVGAGYAGLATAIELRRRGHEVEVFESTKALTKQGNQLNYTSFISIPNH